MRVDVCGTCSLRAFWADSSCALGFGDLEFDDFSEGGKEGGGCGCPSNRGGQFSERIGQADGQIWPKYERQAKLVLTRWEWVRWTGLGGFGRGTLLGAYRSKSSILN